jgi:hypothetical protein
MLYWSVSRFDLGLSQEEFFLMQPRQLHALMKRWELSEENREFMPAQIASAVVNYSMGAPTEPVKADDFMPSRQKRKVDKRERVRLRKVDRELAATQIRGVMAGMMRIKNG